MFRNRSSIRISPILSRSQLGQSSLLSIEGKSPLQKFSHSLLGFKSSSTLQVPSASISSYKSNDWIYLKRNDMVKYRSALYRLKQKKELSRSEQEQIQLLSTKLRALDNS